MFKTNINARSPPLPDFKSHNNKSGVLVVPKKADQWKTKLNTETDPHTYDNLVYDTLAF